MNWKNHRSSLLAAVACLAFGCMDGSGTPDDENPPETDAGTTQTKARLTANWSIRNVDGTTVPCGSQYTKVKVFAQAFQGEADSIIRTGDPFTAMFDCAAGTGTLELPTSGEATPDGGSSASDINGKYDVWISQTEPSGQLERQTSRTTFKLDLASGNKSFTATLYENGGYRLMNWGLIAASTANPMSCAASGVDTIEVMLVNEDTQQVTTNRFPCAGDPNIDATGYAAVGAGITSPVVAGRYTVSVSAYSNNEKVGTSEPETEELIENLSRINVVADHHFITISTR